jgi:hypothetical protein
MALAAVIAFNPIGIDAIHAAFISNEALSRNIWGPIALTGIAMMASTILLEWGTRKFIISRRARRATTLS